MFISYHQNITIQISIKQIYQSIIECDYCFRYIVITPSSLMIIYDVCTLTNVYNVIFMNKQLNNTITIILSITITCLEVINYSCFVNVDVNLNVNVNIFIIFVIILNHYYFISNID